MATFIIYYDYPNTSGNHAGMAYFARQFKKSVPDTHLIRTPSGISKWPVRLQKIWRSWVVNHIKLKSSVDDVVLFLEYLTNASGWQTEIAFSIRKKKIPVRLHGLVHLSGTNLLEIYSGDQYIRKSAEVLDKIIVFGSSLKKFFSCYGFENKIEVTFHYGDTDFYKPDLNKATNNILSVICIGNIKRNFNKLCHIIASTPDIEYHICLGKANLNSLFSNFSNVKLYRFLKESELLKLMQQCDVSLSVMEDTIGSNVITTSFACGLVNIVSDVGSIKDYCNINNSFICNSDSDFVRILTDISHNRKLLASKRENSLLISKEFSLNNSIKAFTKIIHND